MRVLELELKVFEAKLRDIIVVPFYLNEKLLTATTALLTPEEGFLVGLWSHNPIHINIPS